MAIVYTDDHSRFFYVIKRYQVDHENWIHYTNSLGEEFTCREEAFNFRFQPVENES
jgi:hypothetical protein